MPSGYNGVPPASCHPNRPHYGKGLCHSCWSTRNRRNNPKKLAQHRAYSRHYNKKFSKRRRFNIKKYKYGITEPYFDALLLKQKNSCKICKHFFSEELYPCVDHDHQSGKIRGLLCAKCNYGLGNFKDDVKRLAAAIDYLLEQRR